MKKWISFPRIEGTVSRQAHCDLPDGTYERELGRDGFFGPATHMLHKHPPTGWIDWEGPLRPRAFDLTKLEALSTSPWQAQPILANAHMKLRQWRTQGCMDHLVRNSDGDELLFVHQGAGELYCDYGHLSFRDGDHIVIPRATLWRIECHEPVTLLMIEATEDAYVLPDKGLVGNHAIFDPAMLDTPRLDDAFRAQQNEEPWKVVIKRRDRYSTVTFPFNPLDAVGWHGDLAPVRINWRDIRPLMSHRYHLPPSAHTTFLTKRFVVCTFAPRPIESDPGALKVPFFHNNDDYDEIIFYHKGSFFSRDNIHPGMITLHPCGFAHGPHPKAFAIGAKAARKETDEVAVMIDTRDPVDLAELPEGVEDRTYVDSWKSPGA
ncbi:MAG TPA: homogentisate 1,2-dioxygenase [Candidatus Competibacteraceae bacterium]|nr:homogentisate 1,2-dioxygenase [Candidatus Competibacteraceae bacterium]